MSSRSSRYTCFTRYPWMSIPRICPATERASSSESAGLIPPALPRPPTRTCALTMQGSGGSTTSSGLEAVTPRGIGMPYRAKVSFALYSRNFTRDRSRRWVDDLYLLSWRSNLDRRTRGHHEVPERLHDLLRRGPGPAISDRPTVQFDDGPDLRRGPADERLVRGPDVVQGEEPFLRLQAKLRDDLEDRLPGDPWEVRGGPRGNDRRVADDEEVLRGGLRHISVDVEHQGLVGAVLVRLDPGHDVVQVVQRLDRRAQALGRHAPVRGGHHLQAPLVHLAVQREARLRNHDHARPALALPRVEAEIPLAPRDHGPDVSFADFVPPARLEDDVRHLLLRVRDFQVDGFGRVIEPVEVAVQLEDSAVVGADPFEQADVQVARLLRDVGGKGRDVGFRPAGPPGVHEGLMVPSLAVVLPDELLAQFDLLPLLVRLEIPEPVFIRGPERVHKHQAPLLVHRELFLAIHVNQAAFPDLCVETSIDFEDRPYEGVELRAAQLRNPQRFVFRELAVHFFQLRRHFDKRVREGLSVLRRMTSRKADRFRPDFACLNPIVERAGHVVSGDHLEGNQEIVGGRRNAIVFGNHLDAAHPHSVPVDDPQEVRADAEPLNKLEPMGRRAAERLSFMRDERRDHFVEHADLVREDELEFVVRHIVDLLHLALSEEPHAASCPAPGDERDLLGVWVNPQPSR